VPVYEIPDLDGETGELEVYETEPEVQVERDLNSILEPNKEKKTSAKKKKEPIYVELTPEELCQHLKRDSNCVISSLAKRNHLKTSKMSILRKEDIVLVDQADVEIIKIQFMGMMVDISIG
jgi:hypothetical protein